MCVRFVRGRKEICVGLYGVGWGGGREREICVRFVLNERRGGGGTLSMSRPVVKGESARRSSVSQKLDTQMSAALGRDAACPISTGCGTRRVRLVRGVGRGVSD